MARLIYSASRIERWEICRLLYYLNYHAHEKLPINGRMALGIQVHRMAAEIHQKNFKNAESFANSFKNRWNRIVGQGQIRGDQIVWRGKDEGWILRAIGISICKRLWEIYHNDPNVLAWEYPFNFILDGRHFRGSFDEIRMGDLIDYDGFRFYQPVIRDLKTGPRAPGEMAMAHNLQFVLYTVALGCLLYKNVSGLRDKFGIPTIITNQYAGNPIYAAPIIGVELHYPREERFVPINYKDADWAVLCAIADQMEKEINEGNFLPNWDSCGYCHAGGTCLKYLDELGLDPGKKAQLTIIAEPPPHKRRPKQLKLFKRGELPRT